jgi:TATA-box binding protein (TBP) (component of TFIID and TFIIIB)
MLSPVFVPLTPVVPNDNDATNRNPLLYSATQFKGKARVLEWKGLKQTSREWCSVRAELRKVGIGGNRNESLKKPDYCAYLYSSESDECAPQTERKAKKQAKGIRKCAWSTVQFWPSGCLVISARTKEGACEAYELFLRKARSCRSFSEMRLSEIQVSNIVVDGRFEDLDLSYERLLARAKKTKVRCVYGKSTHAPELKVTLNDGTEDIAVRLWSSGKFSIQGCKDEDRVHKVFLQLSEFVRGA